MIYECDECGYVWRSDDTTLEECIDCGSTNLFRIPEEGEEDDQEGRQEALISASGPPMSVLTQPGCSATVL